MSLGWKVGLFALVTAACQGTAPRPAPVGVPTLLPTATYTATEAAFAANLNPLTGLPSADPDIGQHRPDAFALGVAPGHDLPDGAQSAEIMVEALYPSTPGFTLVTQERPGNRPDVGPLAPAGARDAAAARAFGASLTATGAPPELLRALTLAGVPLTLVTGESASDVAGTPAGPRAPSPRWAFSVDAAPAAQLTPNVTLRAAGRAPINWRYDPLIGVWHRWLGDLPAVVPGTGEALPVANVVLLELAGEPGEMGWWTGEGRARLLRDGTALEGRWVRSEQAVPLGLLDGSGAAMALRPGSTWLELVPEGSEIVLGP